MKKQFIFLIFGMIFLIELMSVGSATETSWGVSKQNNSIMLTQTCDSCTFVNITSIQAPDKTFVLITETLMQKLGTLYNYSSNYTQQVGTYIVTGHGDDSGTDTTWAASYVITPSGTQTNSGNSLIIFIGVLFFLILGILCFIAYLKTNKMQVKWTFILASVIFFLAGVNLISSLIPDALINTNVVNFFDKFTAISYILFWFAFGLIIIMWALTFIKTFFYDKNKKNLEKYG